MKRILSFCIGALLAVLAVIAVSVIDNPSDVANLHGDCPPADQIIAAWEQIADDYHNVKITLDELIHRI